MLKAPRLGEVKTRLAKDVGAPAALAAYRRLVEHQLRAIPEGWNVEIHFTPLDAQTEMRTWLAPLTTNPLAFYAQASGDLGARLQYALSSALARGAALVIFAGGDCAELGQERMKEAASEAVASDVVIIPALDGGYVLLALHAPHLGLFTNIAWSTEVVLQQTKERISELSLTCKILPPLEDVDDLPSWLRAQHALGASL